MLKSENISSNYNQNKFHTKKINFKQIKLKKKNVEIYLFTYLIKYIIYKYFYYNNLLIDCQIIELNDNNFDDRIKNSNWLLIFHAVFIS